MLVSADSLQILTVENLQMRKLQKILHEVKVELPVFGPLLCQQPSLSVNLWGVGLRESELDDVGERTLLQVVATQGQKLLELTAHFIVLAAQRSHHKNMFQQDEKKVEPTAAIKPKTLLYSWCQLSNIDAVKVSFSSRLTSLSRMDPYSR